MVSEAWRMRPGRTRACTSNPIPRAVLCAGYFRAYTGGDAIMADCLYGQQVAFAHGLGLLVPAAYLAQHLKAELLYNSNLYGLTVCTGRHTLPPLAEVDYASAGANFATDDETANRKAARAGDVRALMQQLRARGDGQDDAVWMGGAPTWSCVALQMGGALSAADVTAALEPTRWELENYRTRLASMWDLTGLSTTSDWGSESANGQPFCTSHYGFMLPDY